MSQLISETSEKRIKELQGAMPDLSDRLLPSDFRKLFLVLKDIADTFWIYGEDKVIVENFRDACPDIHDRFLDSDILRMVDGVGRSTAYDDFSLFGETVGKKLQFEGRLPVDMTPSREAFEEMGIKFGEICDFPLFVEATLPVGWRRIQGEEPSGYWSYLVDKEGQKRVHIFEKLSPHDDKTYMRLISAE